MTWTELPMGAIESNSKTVEQMKAVPKQLAIGTLRFFQLCISPLYRPCCRFYPSCSQYAVDAISKFGVIRGMWLAMARLARCHPLANDGVDLVPEQFEYFPWRNRESLDRTLDSCDRC